MPQANFGSGDLIFIPPAGATDITPIRFGTLQEVQLDYSSSVKFLQGGNQFAVDAANGEAKLSGKAKVGKIGGRQLFAALAGATIATGSTLEVTEVGVVATHAFTVSGSATFVTNAGVYDAQGNEYKQVAATPVGLQYTVSAGVYTFETATQDGKSLTFRYTKTQTAGSTLTLGNQAMGIAVKYKVELFNTFTANGSQVLGGELAAVVIPKLTLPFKNTDFTIPDIDFECLDDGSGNVAKFYINT